MKVYKPPWLKTILVVFLKIRLVIIIIPILFLYGLVSLDYPRYVTKWVGKQYVYPYFYDIREKYEIINNILQNSMVIIDGKFNLLFDSFLFTVSFLFSIFIIRFIINHLMKKSVHKNLSSIITTSGIIGWSFFYFLSIKNFSIIITSSIVSILLMVYIFDFIVFENLMELKTKLFDYILLIGIGISEIFFTPSYIKFLKSLKSGKKINPKIYLNIRNIHFYLLIFLIIILLSPFSNSYAYDIFPLLCDKDTYGLALSEKTHNLFFTRSKAVYSIPFNNPSIIKTVYEHPGGPGNSEMIEINDDREELYIINRNNLSLVIINTSDYSVIGNVSSEGFNYGDSRLDSSDSFVFVINDDPFFVYKIDPSAQKILIQKRMETYNSDLAYNKKRDVLYVTEWQKSGDEDKYVIYELDGKTLEILRTISVPGPTWDIEVTKDSKKLFCALPFESLFNSYVYIFDTESFNLIDKIKVPLGTRAIAVDEERGFLFAGSAATNLIELIDLKTKKTLRTYKAGDFSLRQIILDKKEKNFYVSTQRFYLFKGKY